MTIHNEDSEPQHDDTRYYLGPDIYGCETQGGTVLLDLRTNRYFGVDVTDSRQLAHRIQNWPTRGHAGQFRREVLVPETIENDLIEYLTSRNIVQHTSPSSTGIQQATFSLGGDLVSVGDEIIVRSPVRLVHIAVFFSCLLLCKFALRFLPLRLITNVVARRKACAVARGYEYDPDRAAQLTCIFRRIRPYFFVADGKCMLHALLLVNYLAFFGEYPAWVLGVRSIPWGAHSWVQHECHLLDTNPAKVCSYDPILSI